MSNLDKSIELYNEAQLYDDIMWWKKDDINFWLKIIKKFRIKKILELCCGTGRIGNELINEDLDYHGIDISKSFIDFFKNKNKNQENIICKDARSFNNNHKYDLIFIGFNSISHILKNTDLQNMLKCVKNHMHEDSLFIIDTFVPHADFLYKEPSLKKDILDFINTQNKKKLTIYESANYDSENEINNIRWEFFESKNKLFYYDFKMRMYFPDTLFSILAELNYSIEYIYGDYDLNTFNEKSEKQIYLCKNK
tara:strand:+ start:14656 stop:15411 length:756 start_codon:yes stop_codon:yes gene_type:complete